MPDFGDIHTTDEVFVGPDDPPPVINTDGDPGTTIYVGTVDPDIAYDLLPGDVWLDTSS